MGGQSSSHTEKADDVSRARLTPVVIPEFFTLISGLAIDSLQGGQRCSMAIGQCPVRC
jgi:hypothetical protein